MVEARDDVYSEPTDTMRGTRSYHEGPPPRDRAQERKLDIAVPSWPDIDARIQAFIEMERQRFEQALASWLEEERDFWREVFARALAQALDDAPPGPQGPPGPAGKLPSVRVWKAGQVSYENEVFAYEGGSYQALRDTAQAPGGTDWVQIALAGRDGIIPQLRGTYDPKESYKRFDIVALNGSSFICKRDDPGECPGSGWQLHASAGRSGGRGEKGDQGPRGMTGERGPKGDSGLSIVGWEIDAANYAAIPVMSNGRKGPALQLREIFKQFVTEAR
jgi:hypothetical protein